MRHGPFLLVAAALLVAGFAISTPICAAGPAVYELAPGVVVDRGNSAVYTMHPGRAVEALSLDQGSRQWLSKGAEKPYWSDGLNVYAQRIYAPAGGYVHIITLDAGNGEAYQGSMDVPLSPGVDPGIDQQARKSFSFSMQGIEQDLAAVWKFMDQGALRAPWPDAQPPTVIFEQGAALLDPVNRSVQTFPADAFSAGNTAPDTVKQLLEQGDLAEPFWLAGEVAAAILDQPASDGQKQIILKRWDVATGLALEDLDLFLGRVITTRAAADQQHILISSRTGQAVRGIQQYAWSIYSLASGELAGRVEFNRSALPFSVVDDTLMVLMPAYGHRVGNSWTEVPPAVQRLDLLTGSRIWEAPIRDTLYRGPAASAREGE